MESKRGEKGGRKGEERKRKGRTEEGGLGCGETPCM
jgi:hypothetical protein